MPTAVVSVRVPRQLKEEAESLGVDIKRVVEESLRRAVFEKKEKSSPRPSRRWQKLAAASP